LVANNGLSIGDEGEFEKPSLDYAPKPNKITNIEACTSAAFMPIPCYGEFLSVRLLI
jgi:hypothetical protein